jgi:hypothetical protein
MGMMRAPGLSEREQRRGGYLISQNYKRVRLQF